MNMDGIRISVVIATFNGSTTIKEQLLSILCQTRQPDEVIISDDNSTDNTCKTILDFIGSNHLSNWHLFSNKKRLGYKDNFFFGFSKCSGTLIFPCDQDDIWLNNKIEDMSQAMIKHKQINVLYCNPILWDCGASKNRFKYKKFEEKFRSLNDGQVHKEKETLGKKMRVQPGCVLCFRTAFLSQFAGLDKANVSHDFFICSLGALSGSMSHLDIPVIKWRQSLSSTSRPHKYTKKDKLEMLTETFTFLSNLLLFQTNINIDMKATKKEKNFFAYRIRFLKKPLLFFIPLVFHSHYAYFDEFLSDLKYAFRS